MRTEAEAFLQRIRAYPDDDAQRLIFADWLDEEGDPRGRFVRVQLALAALPAQSPEARRWLVEESALLSAHRAEWEAPFRGLASGCVFRRGFVDEAKVEARVLLRHGADLFAAGPLRHLHLLDVADSLPAVLRSPYLGRLAALTIHAQHVGEPLARALAQSDALAGLKRLAVTRNRLGDGAAELLARAPHLARLEELNLSENEIGETGARALAAAPNWPRLARLELRDNRLGAAGAEALAGSERLPALAHLGLAGNDAGQARVHSLARATDALRVPGLDLCGNGITALAVRALFGRPPNGGASAVRLAELDLSFNPLGDAGAAAVASCAPLAGLRVLRLANCGIGDEGVRALAASPHFDRAEELDLENNPVSDAGFRAFRDTPGWRGLRNLIPPRIGLSAHLRAALDERFNRRRSGV